MVTLSNQESAKREAAEQQQVQGQRCPRRGWGGSREPADTRADTPTSSGFSPSMTGAPSQGL